MGIEIKDDTILSKIQLKINELPQNDAMMTEIHNVFAQYMEPYVPMKEGPLSQQVEVNSKCAHYISEYAHYQYEGIAYGPKIPIYDNGVIVGFYSTPEQSPTGKRLEYSTEKHPKATHHWDKAMMNEKGEAFTSDVKTIVIDTLKKGAE